MVHPKKAMELQVEPINHFFLRTLSHILSPHFPPFTNTGGDGVVSGTNQHRKEGRRRSQGHVDGQSNPPVKRRGGQGDIDFVLR